MPLNIIVLVVDPRGDVLPFLALASSLQKAGHRFEFFPVSGDTADLMAYMVESISQIRAGINQRKRDMYVEMLDGFWQFCIHPEPLSNMPSVADAIIVNPPSFAHVHCAQALVIPVHFMFTMPWGSTKAFPHHLANTGFS
ncbi:UDP-glucose,sterol transferase [Colletotrichum orchidophilum]|uniref:UDP-glucose,sterol transferase n=1 Tax=Colletotrichum orchidophilum TaxID=1209926 RepID=A0A1G4BLR9_9PEZI|nr:UDP-glucose,sterol transferase [Colletotrichum orchidophilum]OHF02409.1 UDP-glucose,sterol transferase [Colletotrichum orchidophilum]